MTPDPTPPNPKPADPQPWLQWLAHDQPARDPRRAERLLQAAAGNPSERPPGAEPGVEPWLDYLASTPLPESDPALPAACIARWQAERGMQIQHRRTVVRRLLIAGSCAAAAAAFALTIASWRQPSTGVRNPVDPGPKIVETTVPPALPANPVLPRPVVPVDVRPVSVTPMVPVGRLLADAPNAMGGKLTPAPLVGEVWQMLPANAGEAQPSGSNDPGHKPQAPDERFGPLIFF